MSEQARGRRWYVHAAWAIAIAVAVAGAAAGIVVARFEPEDLARIVAEQVQARTGRALVIEGPSSYSVSLVPRLSAEKVRLQNASWGSRPDMLTARRIEVQIALLPLLAGRVRIEGLTLIKPDLLLEVDRSGNGNWRLDREAAEAPDGSDPSRSRPPRIDSVRVERGSLTYRDARRERNLQLRIEDLDFEAEGDSAELEGKGTLNDVAVALTARLPLPGAAKATRSEATLTGLGFRVHAQGTAALAGAPAADLAFSAEVTDWPALGKLLQIEMPRLPASEASGMLRSHDQGMAFEKLDVRIGNSRVTGHARWLGAEGNRKLDLKLDSPLLDLAELRSRKSSEPAAGGRIFSAKPFPLALLAALSGNAELRIARLALRDGKSVQDLTLAATFDKGRIEIGPAQIQLDGRPLEIRVHADASKGNVLALDLAIHGRGIPLGALGALLDVTGTPEGSPTDLDIRMRARGDSVRSLMANANGDLLMVVGPGRVRNRVLDFGADVTELLKAINPAYAADPYTELECAVVRLPVRQGVARIANSIGIETSKVDIIAAGTIDFRNETLDLGFRTKAASGLGLGLGTLAELGRLRGSFADPKVEVDMGEAAKTAAHVGLAAITGGLSLIASGLLAERVPDHPCQFALSGKAETAKAAPAQDESGVVENVLGNIRKFFSR